MLLKIGFTSVTQNRPTNVTENCFHKFYSKSVLQVPFKIGPQRLLKINSTSVTQNRPPVLLKICFTKISQNYFD